jgi:hypothetical protein
MGMGMGFGGQQWVAEQARMHPAMAGLMGMGGIGGMEEEAVVGGDAVTAEADVETAVSPTRTWISIIPAAGSFSRQQSQQQQQQQVRQSSVPPPVPVLCGFSSYLF